MRLPPAQYLCYYHFLHLFLDKSTVVLSELQWIFRLIRKKNCHYKLPFIG